MGNVIAAQARALAGQPRIHDRRGRWSERADYRQLDALGPAAAGWGSTDIVVLLDWSEMAGSFFGGHVRPTGDVGAAVADKLLGADSIPDLVAPLASFPSTSSGTAAATR